jgi:glutamate synthase domain-containing protein 3
MGGTVHLKGSAGSAAGATMRGGLLVIEGDAGARCGAAMKGGTLVVHGDVGFMTGFMMQKGTMIIGGDAGEALGDSLYEGKIYLRGQAENLGSDAIEVDMTEDDAAMLQQVLAQARFDANPADFKKIESGKRLYNFDTKEKEIWKNAM